MPVAFLKLRRHAAVATATVLALAALTCHDTTHFHLLVQGEASLTTQAAPAAVALAGLVNLDLGTHATMRRQNLHVAEVSQLRCYSATLNVLAPATGQDLSFVRALEVVISAPGVQDLVVATGGPFVAGSNSVGLNVHDVDLARYAHGQKLTAALRVTQADAPPVPMVVELSLVLDTQVAQPKGACG